MTTYGEQIREAATDEELAQVRERVRRVQEAAGGIPTRITIECDLVLKVLARAMPLPEAPHDERVPVSRKLLESVCNNLRQAIDAWPNNNRWHVINMDNDEADLRAVLAGRLEA